MRAAVYTPNMGEPHTRLYRPLFTPARGALVITGGSFDVLRGNFPDRADLAVSGPVPFRRGDWLKIWLTGDGEGNPIYFGEMQGEAWHTGEGRLRARGWIDRIRKARWQGVAKGTFYVFFPQVISQAILPRGITLKTPLPDGIPNSVYEADTPFELLGDTISAVLPALGGFVIGVNNLGQLAVVNPTEEVTHRFPAAFADRPEGDTANYVNSIRFSFEYPSGDTGWFIGQHAPGVAATDEEWEVISVTPREVGVGAEPFAARSTTAYRTLIPGGLVGLTATVPRYGGLNALSFNSASNVTLTPLPVAVPDGTPPTNPAPYEGAIGVWDQYDVDIAARFIPGYATVEAMRAGYRALAAPVVASGSANLAVHLRGEVWIETNRKPNLPPGQALRRGIVLPSGLIGWSDPAPQEANPQVDTASGAWEPHPTLPNVYKVRVFCNTDGSDVLIGWSVPARNELLQGGAITPIGLRSGGAVVVDPIPNTSTTLTGRFNLTDAQDMTQASVRLRATADGETVSEGRSQGPFRLFTSVATQETPLQRFAGLHVATGVAMLDLNGEIELPHGSSIEVELLPGGTVSGAWLVRPTGEGDAAAMLGQAASQAQSNNTGLAEGMLLVVGSRVPAQHVVLPAGDVTRDGWARFVVRTPDASAQRGWRILFTGVNKIGRVRIRTPQIDGVATYAGELLRYRSTPVREWTGEYHSLFRVSAQGTVAFEVPGRSQDELLDLQRVTYDLDRNRVIVKAGSPLAATDEDAVAGDIQSIRREQRRPGGNT